MRSGGPLFNRDERGKIDPLNPVSDQAEVWHEFPISSGKAGKGYILTYSGIFRFNRELSELKFKDNPEAPVSYGVFIDFYYTASRQSLVAVHGTPGKNHKFLGKARASHGCIRTFPQNAKTIHKYLMSDGMWDNNLPEFDVRATFPSQI